MEAASGDACEMIELAGAEFRAGANRRTSQGWHRLGSIDAAQEDSLPPLANQVPKKAPAGRARAWTGVAGAVRTDRGAVEVLQHPGELPPDDPPDHVGQAVNPSSERDSWASSTSLRSSTTW